MDRVILYKKNILSILYLKAKIFIQKDAHNDHNYILEALSNKCVQKITESAPDLSNYERRFSKVIIWMMPYFGRGPNLRSFDSKPSSTIRAEV